MCTLARSESQTVISYISALRPWSWNSSIIAVILGNILAFRDLRTVDISIFSLTLVSVLCVHAAGNLVNTFYDYKYGIDTHRCTGCVTLVERRLVPSEVSYLCAVIYACGVLTFILVASISPARIEHCALLFFVGLSGSFLYTGGVGLKYFGLGDLIVMILFGPVSVSYAYILQTGIPSYKAFLFALPLLLNSEAVLHAKNMKNIDHDRNAGIITLAIVLGETFSYFVYCFILFLPYLLISYAAMRLSIYIFLPFLTLAQAFAIERVARVGQWNTIPRKTAILNTLFGILYNLGVLLSCL